MQSDKIKCGLTERRPGEYQDDISKQAYIWYEKDWKHDDYEHSHQRSQLSYTEEGYQYFNIKNKVYLVPQNHVIWIPSGVQHRISSNAETVNLVTALFKDIPDNDFFNSVHVFPAPNVLREMLMYASKWNKVLSENEEQKSFLQTILLALPGFCEENNYLEVPVPQEARLVSVCEHINMNYSFDLKTDELAELGNMSVRNLQRIFKSETGITLQKYIQLIRILKSIELINSRKYTLTEIAYKIGYKSLSAFTSSYKQIMKTGVKTSQY